MASKDDPEFMAKVVARFKTLIAHSNGEKATKFLTDVLSALWQDDEIDNTLLENFDYIGVLEDLIASGEIIEIEFTTPAMPWRAKSFFLPKGSHISKITNMGNKTLPIKDVDFEVLANFASISDTFTEIRQLLQAAYNNTNFTFLPIQIHIDSLNTLQPIFDNLHKAAQLYKSEADKAKANNDNSTIHGEGGKHDEPG